MPAIQKSYKKLIIYQKPKKLVLLIYQTTKTYPKEELFTLVSQMRRSAVSIPSNIVEGYPKSSRIDFVRLLDIAIGSSNELEVQVELSYELSFINKSNFDKINDLLTEVKKLLYSFQRSMREKV